METNPFDSRIYPEQFRPECGRILGELAEAAMAGKNQ